MCTDFAAERLKSASLFELKGRDRRFDVGGELGEPHVGWVGRLEARDRPLPDVLVVVAGPEVASRLQRPHRVRDHRAVEHGADVARFGFGGGRSPVEGVVDHRFFIADACCREIHARFRVHDAMWGGRELIAKSVVIVDARDEVEAVTAAVLQPGGFGGAPPGGEPRIQVEVVVGAVE